MSGRRWILTSLHEASTMVLHRFMSPGGLHHLHIRTIRLNLRSRAFQNRFQLNIHFSRLSRISKLVVPDSFKRQDSHSGTLSKILQARYPPTRKSISSPRFTKPGVVSPNPALLTLLSGEVTSYRDSHALFGYFAPRNRTIKL